MSNLSFKEETELNWKQIHKQLFGDNIPGRKEWTVQSDIINVLNTIGRLNPSNHTFFPNGGGMDLRGATESNEKGAIEVNFNDRAYILSINKVEFNSFNDDLQWNYFRIETNQLEPTGVYEAVEYSEELTEISPLHYVSRSAWDEQYFNEEPLPPGSRLVIRKLKGSFVIFSKVSIYNSDPTTYDARHDKNTGEEFRQYIENNI